MPARAAATSGTPCSRATDSVADGELNGTGGLSLASTYSRKVSGIAVPNIVSRYTAPILHAARPASAAASAAGRRCARTTAPTGPKAAMAASC